uniref:Interleukin-20 n=1 Tax=Neogobius melanostomus TaxID=47308 RepID=A0A8C6WKE8_9GOBI
MQLQYFVPLCLLLVLGWLGRESEGRTVILDKCVVNVHIHELQKHYSSVRSAAVSRNEKTNSPVMNEGQTCCFIRLLLRFFVERVFAGFSTSEAEEQRAVSALANGFISVRNSIHTCHCQCKEDTQRIMDSIITKFDEVRIKTF